MTDVSVRSGHHPVVGEGPTWSDREQAPIDIDGRDCDVAPAIRKEAPARQATGMTWLVASVRQSFPVSNVRFWRHGSDRQALGLGRKRSSGRAAGSITRDGRARPSAILTALHLLNPEILHFAMPRRQ